jgi:hypothetical protein
VTRRLAWGALAVATMLALLLYMSSCATAPQPTDPTQPPARPSVVAVVWDAVSAELPRLVGIAAEAVLRWLLEPDPGADVAAPEPEGAEP